MSVGDDDRFVGDVDRHMLGLVARRPGPIADLARGPIEAGGKRLRPLLVRAARPPSLRLPAPEAQAYESCALRAAAAIELVHTASLVHDDLLDGATLRRGGPTVGATHGAEQAMAVGDLLFALAFTTLAECRPVAGDVTTMRSVRLLARASRTLAVGEALQAEQVRRVDLPEAAYMHRCECKTGALFAAALCIGGLLGGAGGRDVELLARFGATVGIAFQVVDDLLDLLPDERADQLGKRPGADLRDGTMTLPLLLAAERDPALARLLADPVPQARVDEILERVHATGAIATAQQRANALRDEALALLDGLEGDLDLASLAAVGHRSVRRAA